MQIKRLTNGAGGSSGLTLKTNGTSNGSQTLLNLAQGTNVTITDNGSGVVTINANPNVPTTITSANLAGQTGAVASIVAAVVGQTDATYRVDVYATIISQTGGKTIEFRVTFTDETSTVVTKSFFAQTGTGSGVTNPGNYGFNEFIIRCKAASTITISSVVIAVPGGTINYNCGGIIEFLS